MYLISTSREPSATVVATAGDIPSPRVGHASALIGSVLIVWGGNTKTDRKANQMDKQDDGLYLLNLGKKQLSSSKSTCLKNVQYSANGLVSLHLALHLSAGMDML